MKDVSFNIIANNNPSFTLRNNGRLNQKVKLLNASMQYIVVGACSFTSHINIDNADPAGLPLVRIYFEDRFNKTHTDASIEVIMTEIDKDGWGQIGVVKQIPEDTLYLHLELFQANLNISRVHSARAPRHRAFGYSDYAEHPGTQTISCCGPASGEERQISL